MNDEADDVLVTTTEHVPGCHYRIIGEVFSNSTFTRNGISRFGAKFKSKFGGNIGSYTKLQTKARDRALRDLKRKALDLGGNAVVMMRYDSGSIGAGNRSSDLLSVTAYGTAVKLTGEQDA